MYVSIKRPLVRAPKFSQDFAGHPQGGSSTRAYRVRLGSLSSCWFRSGVSARQSASARAVLVRPADGPRLQWPRTGCCRLRKALVGLRSGRAQISPELGTRCATAKPKRSRVCRPAPRLQPRPLCGPLQLLPSVPSVPRFFPSWIPNPVPLQSSDPLCYLL